MVRRTQRTLLFETLESRKLFAGVTILTHGLAGEVDGWVDSLSTAIVARAGGSANASVYTWSSMTIPAASASAVSRATRDPGLPEPPRRRGDYQARLDGRGSRPLFDRLGGERRVRVSRRQSMDRLRR
jgi:hypothetical protein